MAEQDVAVRGTIDYDDTVSVTSTISDVFSETREFEVERIVAERTFQDDKRFLISWLGYPEWQSTWEPRGHIQDDSILEAWDRRKKLEEEHEVQSFDVEVFEETVRTKLEEKLVRHRRRKAKKKRLNMSVSSSEEWDDLRSAQPDDSDSSVEATEVAEDPEDDPGIRVTKLKHRRSFTESSNNGPEVQRRILPLPSPYLGTARPTGAKAIETNKRSRTDSDSPDTPGAVKRARSDNSQKHSAGSYFPSRVDGIRGNHSSAASSTSVGQSLSREDLVRLGTMRGRSSTRSASASRGQRATRGGMTSKKTRRLILTSSDPKQAPKLFSTLRIRRKAELQARQIADGPPDLEVIGGLFDPSKPSTYKALKPADIRKRGAQDKDEDNGLFVDQEEPTASQDGLEPQPPNGSWKEISYQKPSNYTPSKPDMTTCFFWYKHQNDPNHKDCVNGDEDCERLHSVRPGIPIASPPAGYVERIPEALGSEQRVGESSATRRGSGSFQSIVCFFWHRKEIRGKQKGCSHTESHERYLHDWYDGAVVAPAPPGYSERDELDSWAPTKGFRLEKDSSAAIPRTVTTGSHQVPVNEEAASFDNSNPDHATCWFYDRGLQNPSEGGCIKGNKCKYFHFYAAGLRIAHPPASHLMRLHSNGSGHASNNDGSADLTSLPQTQPQGYTASSEQADHRSRGPSQFRPLYSEAAGFDAICYDWHDTGICPVRTSCQFLHINDIDAPVAPKSTQPRPSVAVSQLSEDEKQRRARAIPQITKASRISVAARETYRDYLTCYYWDLNGSCSKGYKCGYLHGYVDGVPIALPPNSSVCKFWLRGNCFKTAEDCGFFHSLPAVSSVFEMRNSTEDMTPLARRRKSVSFATDKSVHVFDEPTAASEPNIDDGMRSQQRNGHFPEDHGRPETLPPLRNDDTRSFVHEPGNNAANTVTSGVTADEQITNAPHVDHNTTSSNSNNSPFAHATKDRDTSWHSELHLDEDTTHLVGSPVEYLPVDEAVIMEDEAVNGEDQTMQRLKSSADGVYHRNNRIAFRGTGTKQFKFGHGKLESRVALATFGDMTGLKDLWAQQLSNYNRIHFDQMVLAEDMLKHFTKLQSERLWQGDLIPVDSFNTSSRPILDSVLEEMKIRLSGLISACQEFVILIYPQGSAWDFIEASKEGPTRARLRFVIFRSNLDIGLPLNLRAALNPDGTAVDSGPSRKTLVKAIHGLRFKDILPIYNKSKQNPWNFYLMLPSTTQDLASFLTSWIHSSCKGKVYSSHDRGSWDFFLRSSHSESGVVFIHQTCINDVYKFPSFQDLSKKNIAFWCISDSTIPSTLSYDSWESKLGRIGASTLMPHGHAFLLTPSFLLAEPLRVYEMLEWFFGSEGRHGKADTSTPGTWKLVACNGLADYLLELAILKAKEKETFGAENRDKPSYEQMLEDRGLDFPACKLRWKIHQKLIQLEARHVEDLDYPSLDPNLPDEYSPIVQADPGIDPNDEKILVEWFAAWALRNLNRYRKFTVVGTNDRGSNYASRMALIQTKMSVGSMQSVNLRMESSTLSPIHGSLMEIPVLDNQVHTAFAATALDKARAIAARDDLPHSKSRFRSTFKEITKTSANVQDNGPEVMDIDSNVGLVQSQGVELNTAKAPVQNSHPESRETIAIDDAGTKEQHDSISTKFNDNLVPENVLFPQINTGPPGYISPYAIQSTCIDAKRSHQNQYKAVDLNTTQMQNNFKLTHVDDAQSEQSRGLKNPEIKEIQFEPTTVWYEAFKANNGGVGYEHLFVDGWEKAFVNIGMRAISKK